MDSRDLKSWQLDRIKMAMDPMRCYLHELSRRCHARFGLDDKLSRDAWWAHGQVQGLWMTLHYLGCHGQVGHSPDDPSESWPDDAIDTRGCA
jgi:hypothetical protein